MRRGFIVILVLLALVMWAGCSTGTGTTPGVPSEPVPTVPVVAKTLNLKVTKFSYEYGYLQITGVLTNTSTVSIYSPTIKLEVYSSDDKVLLADDSAWATGTMLEDFLPGKSAGIDFFTSVSGEPKNIKYKLTCEDAKLTVVYPAN